MQKSMEKNTEQITLTAVIAHVCSCSSYKNFWQKVPRSGQHQSFWFRHWLWIDRGPSSQGMVLTSCQEAILFFSFKGLFLAQITTSLMFLCHQKPCLGIGGRHLGLIDKTDFFPMYNTFKAREVAICSVFSLLKSR